MLFSQLIAGPLTFIWFILIIFILRSGLMLLLITRKNEIIIYKWRIRRGIPDEIDRLELDLAKIELEIEEYEKDYENSSADGWTITTVILYSINVLVKYWILIYNNESVKNKIFYTFIIFREWYEIK